MTSRAGALASAALLVLLAGCAAQQQPCAVPGTAPMRVAELFFGRDIPGRAPLTEAEWAEFAATVITPAFPDGFTSFDGEGQWRDPRSGAVVRERTKILLAGVPETPELAGRIDRVADAYRARFAQVSVGVLVSPACGAF